MMWAGWILGGEVMGTSTNQESPRALPLAVMPKSVQFLGQGTEPLIAVTTVGESLVIIDSTGRVRLTYEGS